MFQRAATIIFIVMANISLLTISAIPHHHHNNSVCFKNNHNHDSASHDERDNGKSNPDNCILKIQVILPSCQEDNVVYCTGCADNNSPVRDLNQAILYKRISEFIPVSVRVASYIHSISSYSCTANLFLGLRSPPLV